MSDEFLEEELEEFPILVLVDEEGNEHEFELMAELEIDDDTYRVLLPFAEENEEIDEDELEVLILKVVYDEDGNEFLSDIDDDEEWERVADAWQELIESEDF